MKKNCIQKKRNKETQNDNWAKIIVALLHCIFGVPYIYYTAMPTLIFTSFSLERRPKREKNLFNFGGFSVISLLLLLLWARFLSDIQNEINRMIRVNIYFQSVVFSYCYCGWWFAARQLVRLLLLVVSTQIELHSADDPFKPLLWFY